MTRLFGPGAGWSPGLAESRNRRHSRASVPTETRADRFDNVRRYLELPQGVPWDSRRPCPAFRPPAMARLVSRFLGAVDLAPRNRFGRM
jgi:hypothetical protein